MTLHSKGARDLSQLREVIDQLFRDGQMVSRMDKSKHELFPKGITRSEGEALRDWVIRESAKATIEIGFGYGISTLFILEGILSHTGARMRHVVVDPFQTSGYKDCGLQNLEDAKVFELVELHQAESQILLPEFLNKGGRFDFAFVDGSHLFENVFADLVFLNRLINAGSIVFIDDYQLPAIRKAVSFFVKNMDWAIEQISEKDADHHWAAVRTAPVNTKRSFLDFVDF